MVPDILKEYQESLHQPCDIICQKTKILDWGFVTEFFMAYEPHQRWPEVNISDTCLTPSLNLMVGTENIFEVIKVLFIYQLMH